MNTYTAVYSNDTIIEMKLPKLTRRFYKFLIDELIFTSHLEKGDSSMKLYCNGVTVAILDLYIWDDGTGSIFLYGSRIRDINREHYI